MHKLITILPKSQRAKNRVREHGNVFFLISQEPNKVLVESTKKTWRLKENNFTWLGWFDSTEAGWSIDENI